MQYARNLRFGFTTLSMLTLFGCATLPNVPSPATRVAATTLSTANSFGSGEAAFPSDRWWAAYGDPTLDALIEEALRAAPDMALADARIRAADAIAEQAGSSLYPSLSIDASAGGAKQSYNMGIPAQFVPKGIDGTGKISAAVGINLDLWGRNRAALAAARSDADAARVDGQQARLLLTTSIAAAWVELGQLWDSHDIAARAVQIRRDTESLTAQRVAAGIDNLSDLELAKSRHAAARADLAATEEAIELSRNRIAALVGAGPDRGATLPQPSLGGQIVNGTPDNLALNLLGRRPDIVAARLRTEAAARRVKVAKLDFYPNINISAMTGLQSLGLSNLFERASTTANFGPAISLPIFDGGRLSGRYRGAGAAYDEAVARYNATLIGAFREVADTLDSRRALVDRLSATTAASAAADKATDLARKRYRSGIASLLQALAAEDAALNAQRAKTDMESRARLLDITLTRALGGGFQSTSQNNKAGS